MVTAAPITTHAETSKPGKTLDDPLLSYYNIKRYHMKRMLRYGDKRRNLVPARAAHTAHTEHNAAIQRHGGGKNMGTNILPLCAGMHVQMKKKHPCGCATFLILRAGADVRARCTNCGRELMMGRVKFEKAVKRLLDPPRQTSENSSHDMPSNSDTDDTNSETSQSQRNIPMPK